MRFRLIPGLLSQQRIEYDELHQKLMVNLHLVPLSATQYVLVMALLRQRQRWQDTQGREPILLSVQQLMQVGAIPTYDVLRYHVCIASARLESQGLLIASLRSYGYAIFSTSELLDPALF
jgi:hypothetical protein